MITPEERTIVRMRFIARAQFGTLHLHPDLCYQVLNDYGCNAIEIEPTTDTKQGLIEANWPTPSNARGRYLGTLLPNLTQQILVLTEQKDAAHAAHALTDAQPQPEPRKGEYLILAGAKSGACRSCGAAVLWITTANGRPMPLSVATIEERDGARYALSHFSDCPQGKGWSKK